MSLAIRLHRTAPDSEDTYEPKSWEVGIDLGSTYSAVGYCSTPEHTKDLIRYQAIKPVKNYPRGAIYGSGKSSRCEIPTELYYEPGTGGPLIGNLAVNAKKSPKMSGLHFGLFKMLFHDQEDTEDRGSQIAAKLASLSGDKTVDRITRDFLEQLIKHVRVQMIEFGGYDERDKTHLTCTVPAIWPLRAKRRILKAYEHACALAGLRIEKDISIWSEPEAATAYVLATEEEMSWSEGETFILLDAGGITMDIVTYTIIEMSPLRLKEVVRGDGKLCGATDLNRRFVEEVSRRLSDERGQLDASPNSRSFEQILQDIEYDFESKLKPGYDGSKDFVEFLRVPGLAANESKGFERSEMEINRTHLEDVFLPVLNTAWSLVKSQLDLAYQRNRKPNRLICVGGLACSQRFRVQMRQMTDNHVELTHRDDIKCIFPDCSDFAIAAGAICRSLEQCVVEDYISRSTIAICQHEIYKPRSEEHRDAKPVFDEYEQREYVHDCVTLLLKPEQVIPKGGRTETRHLHQTIDWNVDTVTLSLTILESDSNEVAEGYPRQHPKNKGFHNLEEVSFNIDVAKLRSNLSKRKTKDLRKSSRTRKGNPRLGIEPPCARTTGTPNQHYEVEASPSTPTSASQNEMLASPECPGTDYMWINYQLVVEFTGVLMEYNLTCPTTKESMRGQVSLAPSMELWAAYG